MNDFKLPFIYRATVWMLFVVSFIFILIAAKNLLYPVGLAILIAFLLYPVATFLEERARLPRWAATLLSILLAIVIFGGTIFIMVEEFQSFILNTPRLKERVIENVEAFQAQLQRSTNLSVEQQDKWIKDKVGRLFGEGSEMLNKAVSSTITSIVNFLLLPVYSFFLLFYRDKFYRFLFDAINQRHHERVDNIMKDISQVTQKYMSGIMTVVLILCVLNSFGLYIVGAQYAILLGIVSALFNFIPYFGTVIGGGIALSISVLLQGNTSVALGIVILFVIIQFLENNILTPRITGGRVKLNPFITILSIIVGGMVWGIPGMFLAVPFLGMFKIVCDNVEELAHVSRLLGAEREKGGGNVNG